MGLRRKAPMRGKVDKERIEHGPRAPDLGHVVVQNRRRAATQRAEGLFMAADQRLDLHIRRQGHMEHP